MNPRISLITLGVRDLARSRQFYEQGLSLPVRPFDSEGVVFFDLKGTVLSLFLRQEPAKDATLVNDGSGFPGFSLAHNVESKEAVKALIDQAVAAGARLVKPAHDVFGGG